MSTDKNEALRFRKKPVVIEAMQWFANGDAPHANIVPIDSDHWRCKQCGHDAHKHGNCPTLEGWHIVCPGDWIITGIKGEHYPCKPDIFAATYEPASLAAPASGAAAEAVFYAQPGLVENCHAIASVQCRHSVVLSTEPDDLYSVPLYLHPPSASSTAGEAVALDTRWHDAVLAACMRIEGGYKFEDADATVRAIEQWWYALGGANAAEAFAPSASSTAGEAVKYEERTRPEWDERAPWSKWQECSRETYEHTLRNPVSSNDWRSEVRALYTHPTPAAGEHPDDAAVDAFAARMKAKLAKARAKGRGGWDGPECNAERLSTMLRDHVAKGDPVDVANFCMFLSQRGEGITPSASSTAGEAEELARCKSSRERWIAMSCEFEHRLETLRSSLWSIVEHWKRRADESEYGPAYASCADEIKAELIDDAATPPSASTSAATGAVDEDAAFLAWFEKNQPGYLGSDSHQWRYARMGWNARAALNQPEGRSDG